MKERKIKKQVQGKRTMDGAGVHLVRVLGAGTMYDFDPFLMLDSFDSYNPEDYMKGFPWHPHRGIETITYLVAGEINHQDSLGNKGKILAGESQWMTAGSGIMHQEMPKESPRMLGLQFWLNLPQSEKMAAPHYFDIGVDQIGVIENENGTVRVIAGEYQGVQGAKPLHLQATFYDIEIVSGKEIIVPTKADETAFVFTLEGDGKVAGERVAAKTAVLLDEGDQVVLGALEGSPVRFVFAMAKPLKEPISWGGPIVMNTKEELSLAFDELRDGTFIKENAK